MPPDLQQWRTEHKKKLDDYNCRQKVNKQIKKEEEIRNFPKPGPGDHTDNPFNPTLLKLPAALPWKIIPDVTGDVMNIAYDAQELLYASTIVMPIPTGINILPLVGTMYSDHLGDSNKRLCIPSDLFGISNNASKYSDYECQDSNLDTRRKIVNPSDPHAENSYDDFNRAVTYVDDILYGIPGIPPMGENYFKETNETCILKKPNTSAKLKNKWTYIRNKARGDALYRLGIGDKKTKDKGLLMSVVEDLLDVSPSRLVRILKQESQFEEEEIYTNCKNVKLTNFGDIKSTIFYDKDDNVIEHNDKRVIDIRNAGTIEMFQNNHPTFTTQYETSLEYIINIVCKLSILILGLIIIYKILK